jgi:hypothetical protein
VPCEPLFGLESEDTFFKIAEAEIEALKEKRNNMDELIPSVETPI